MPPHVEVSVVGTCPVCKDDIVRSAQFVFRGDPTKRINGPGGRAQMKKQVTLYCEGCGILFHHVPKGQDTMGSSIPTDKATCSLCGHVYEIPISWTPTALKDDRELWNAYLTAAKSRNAPTTDGYCTQLAPKFECDGQVHFEDGRLFATHDGPRPMR